MASWLSMSLYGNGYKILPSGMNAVLGETLHLTCCFLASMAAMRQTCAKVAWAASSYTWSFTWSTCHSPWRENHNIMVVAMASIGKLGRHGNFGFFACAIHEI